MAQAVFPTGTKFTTFGEIKAAITKARIHANFEAIDSCGRGSIYSRGSHLKIVDERGNFIKGEAESWPFDGTAKSLIAAIDEARYTAGATELWVEGGYDFAVNPRAKADGEYDPWVSDWGVLVWARS